MTRKNIDFRKKLVKLIEEGYSDLTFDEINSEIDEAFVHVAKEKGWATPNKGKPWTDEELTLVLRDAPTEKNALKYARLLGRGHGSVLQVYQWAATQDKVIRAKRPKDKFLWQIKKVAKRLGWRV